MRVITTEQNTKEWFDARCGKLGASDLSRALKMLKKGESSKDREDYKAELIAEMLSGNPTEHYVSPAMDWGRENERIARAEYTFQTGIEVEQTGWVLHPTMDRWGCSPDGLCEADGGLEIKCPNTATHIKWIRDGVVPEQHRDQMYGCMIVCERKWWDFASYDPRLPERFRLFIRRLEWSDEEAQRITDGVKQFWAEVLAEVEAMMESCPEREPLPPISAAQAEAEAMAVLERTELMP